MYVWVDTDKIMDVFVKKKKKKKKNDRNMDVFVKKKDDG